LLAKEFGISRVVVSHIRVRRSWKHLPLPVAQAS
jgi:hypothetical protein